MISDPKIKLLREENTSWPSSCDHEKALAAEVKGQLGALSAMCLYLGWNDVAEHIERARDCTDNHIQNLTE